MAVANSTLAGWLVLKGTHLSSRVAVHWPLGSNTPSQSGPKWRVDKLWMKVTSLRLQVGDIYPNLEGVHANTAF